MRLYLTLIGARIRAQLQYRISFVLDIISFGAMTTVELAVIGALLSRFPSIGGWSFREVALLYGLTAIAFGTAEMIARGFDAPFERMMQQGSFDTVLIRPAGAFFQVIASEFQLRRLGRVIQGTAALSYALAGLPIRWTAAKALVIPLSIASGATIFGALIVFSATVCFWTIKLPEVFHILTSGGQQMVSYPLHIYQGWMRALFLSAIPLGFVSYPAGLYLLDRPDPFGLPGGVIWLAPLVAGLFFLGALRFWAFGVSKYQSSGT